MLFTLRVGQRVVSGRSGVTSMLPCMEGCPSGAIQYDMIIASGDAPYLDQAMLAEISSLRMTRAEG